MDVVTILIRLLALALAVGAISMLVGLVLDIVTPIVPRDRGRGESRR